MEILKKKFLEKLHLTQARTSDVISVQSVQHKKKASTITISKQKKIIIIVRRNNQIQQNFRKTSRNPSIMGQQESSYLMILLDLNNKC